MPTGSDSLDPAEKAARIRRIRSKRSARRASGKFCTGAVEGRNSLSPAAPADCFSSEGEAQAGFRGKVVRVEADGASIFVPGRGECFAAWCELAQLNAEPGLGVGVDRDGCSLPIAAGDHVVYLPDASAAKPPTVPRPASQSSLPLSPQETAAARVQALFAEVALERPILLEDYVPSTAGLADELRSISPVAAKAAAGSAALRTDAKVRDSLSPIKPVANAATAARGKSPPAFALQQILAPARAKRGPPKPATATPALRQQYGTNQTGEEAQDEVPAIARAEAMRAPAPTTKKSPPPPIAKKPPSTYVTAACSYRPQPPGMSMYFSDD